ncbi:MAG TPA: T9SS type A sorting domain-containing protein [Chryseolinea sp.]
MKDCNFRELRLNFRYLLVSIILLSLVKVATCQTKGQWIINYGEDEFAEEALLDLHYLNEGTAGENGFIRLAANGRSFETSNGKPIRFWAVNGGENARDMNDAELATFARFLAKIGVNLIRYHGSICSSKEGSNMHDVDMVEINNIWRVVAAMKKEGIYTAISPFWAGHVSNIPSSWGLGDYKGKVQPWALMYFNTPYKEAYKKWVEVLYTHNNPYTNIPLKDDPAVALIQIKNEDGVLFWTIQGVLPSLLADIERGFYDWLVAKYSSIDNAYAAWSNTILETDDVEAGRMGIYIIWEATQAQSGGKAVRVADQVEFLTTHQRNFYNEVVDFYKTTLGCQQLINASNWKTASSNYLNDAERYSNSVADVLAVNRYHDPQHIGENSGWRIDPGHKYVGKSVLLTPEKLPVNIKQPLDKPFLVTESGWNLPHKYQSEGPFLISAYMSLTGVDGFFWFVPTAKGIDPYPYFDFTNFPGGQKAMHRWTASVPGQMLMFPANALLYRRGYLQEGAPVVQEERTLASLWNYTLPMISEENGFDPNRDTWGNGSDPDETQVPPIAYLAGPVQVKYGGHPSNSALAANLNTLMNLSEKRVTSNTGQLNWNYKDGVCTMNAPSAQGVTGFLKAKSPFLLSDLTIATDDEYATINVVAMDDEPIKTSNKLLVQVGTVYRPTNWLETPDKVMIGDVEYDGFRILNTGVMPWRATESGIRITLKNVVIKSAFALNIHGEKSAEIYVKRNDAEGTTEVRVPKDAIYLVLNSDDPTVVVGAEDQRRQSIDVYPNPAKENIVLSLPENLGHETELQLFDSQGRLVFHVERLAAGTNEIEFPLLPTGLYSLRMVKRGNILLSTKLIIDY